MDMNELSKHNKKNDAWVSYKGKLLNITSFLHDHPGGDSVIMPYLGKDITDAFIKANHSAIAEDMIEDLLVEKTKDKVRINPYKGLTYQVWKHLDLKSYKEFVNTPKSIMGNLRIFDSPFLEPFSKTPWQAVVGLWVPVVSYFFYTSFIEIQFLAALIFLIGLFYWTLFEYLMHRFAFHSEEKIPDNRYAIVLHFLMHGVHHAYPMDDLRLLFPPALGVIMASFFKLCLYNQLLPMPFSDAFFAGKIAGYIYYDLFHYFAHHIQAKKGYMAFMKTYHLAHHYRSPNNGYGVSTHIWDYVFGTLINFSKKYPQLD